MARCSWALANGESHRRKTIGGLVTRGKGYINGSLRIDRAILFLVNALCIKGAEAHRLYFPNTLASRVLTQTPPMSGTYAPLAGAGRHVVNCPCEVYGHLQAHSCKSLTSMLHAANIINVSFL